MLMTSPLLPYRMISRCSEDRDFHGAFMLMWKCCATAVSSRKKYESSSFAAPLDLIAPEPRLRSLFGTTRSGSISILTPRPWQVGQAPCGVLNEKERGSISPSENPSYGQEYCSEKRWSMLSSPFNSVTTTTPSPSL